MNKKRLLAVVRKMKDKRGNEAVSFLLTTGMLLCIFTTIVMAFCYITQSYHANYVCREVTRRIEVCGAYNETEVTQYLAGASNRDLKNPKIKVDAAYWKEQKIQLRDNFQVTYTADYPIKIVQMGSHDLSIDLPIQIKLTGMSEKYWKDGVADSSTMRPKPEQSVELPLNVASGNQVILPDPGFALSSVTILKPEDLIPENIRNGMNIGGVTGTWKEGPVIPSYEGSYTITENGTIQMAGKKAMQDFVVEVPRNENNFSFDVFVCTQEDFEKLIASPTWLDAESVCFIGDGGNLKFTRSDGNGCLIPGNVKRIQGLNRATIEVIDFKYSATNRGAVWMESRLLTDDCSIDRVILNCSGERAVGFSKCTQLTNCIVTVNSPGNGYPRGFDECTKLKNCTVTVIGTKDYSGIGFSGCTNLTDCTSTTVGTNNDAGTGFDYCTLLKNCTAVIPNSPTQGYGFNNCINLTDCTATVKAQYNARSFTSCKKLTGCIATSTTSEEYGDSYGFDRCDFLVKCKKGQQVYTMEFLKNCTNVDAATQAIQDAG